MGAQPRYRTLVERPEYTAALDIITAKYPAHIIEPILSGLLWGITINPQAYDMVYWHLRIVKSRSFDPKTPRFTILFNIEAEGTPEEHVLLCWIEEAKMADEVTEYLM